MKYFISLWKKYFGKSPKVVGMYMEWPKGASQVTVQLTGTIVLNWSGVGGPYMTLNNKIQEYTFERLDKSDLYALRDYRNTNMGKCYQKQSYLALLTLNKTIKVISFEK